MEALLFLLEGSNFYVFWSIEKYIFFLIEKFWISDPINHFAGLNFMLECILFIEIPLKSVFPWSLRGQQLENVNSSTLQND